MFASEAVQAHDWLHAAIETTTLHRVKVIPIGYLLLSVNPSFPGTNTSRAKPKALRPRQTEWRDLVSEALPTKSDLPYRLQNV